MAARIARRSVVQQLAPEPLLTPIALPAWCIPAGGWRALPWRRLLRCDCEGLSLYASIGWCVILVLRPGLFATTPSFSLMELLGSEAHWAVVVGLSSVLQAAGLLGSHRLHLAGNTMASAWWVFVALMISCSGITIGLAVYAPLAAMLALKTFQAAD